MKRQEYSGEKTTNPLRSIDRIMGMLKKQDESLYYEDDRDRSVNSQIWKVSSKTTDLPSQFAYADEDDLKELNDLIVSHRGLGQTLNDFTGTLSEIPNQEGGDNVLNSFSSIYSIPLGFQGPGSFYEVNTRNHDTPVLGSQMHPPQSERSRTVDSQADLISMLDTMKSIMTDSGKQVNQKEIVTGLISYLQSYLQSTSSLASPAKPKHRELEITESQFSMGFSKQNTGTKSCQESSPFKEIPISKLVPPLDFKKKSKIVDFDADKVSLARAYGNKENNRSMNEDYMNMTVDCEYGKDCSQVNEDISILTNYGVVEKDYSISEQKDCYLGFSANKQQQEVRGGPSMGINDISSIKQSLNVSRGSDVYAKDGDFSFEYGLLVYENENVLAYGQEKQNNSLFVVPEASFEDTCAAREPYSTSRKSNRSLLGSGQVQEHFQKERQSSKVDYAAYGKKSKRDNSYRNDEYTHTSTDYELNKSNETSSRVVPQLDLWGKAVMRSNSYLTAENTVRYY